MIPCERCRPLRELVLTFIPTSISYRNSIWATTRRWCCRLVLLLLWLLMLLLGLMLLLLPLNVDAAAVATSVLPIGSSAGVRILLPVLFGLEVVLLLPSVSDVYSIFFSAGSKFCRSFNGFILLWHSSMCHIAHPPALFWLVSLLVAGCSPHFFSLHHFGWLLFFLAF